MTLPVASQVASPIDLGQPPQTAAIQVDQPKKADLARLKRYFTEYRDLSSDARTQSMADIDYYDSKQWTEAEKEALAKRKQPDIVINRVKPAVNGMIGVVARGRAIPRAWPRTPQDEGAADCATDVLRYVADYNRWNRTKLDCLKDMLVPGTMAVLVGADPDLQVTITQIRWEEFFADPRSRRNDFKDGRYMGLAKWMYADDVAALYPDHANDIQGAVDNSAAGGVAPDQSFMDRPNWSTGGWVDKNQRRLLVIEIFYREAQEWQRCVFHGSGILDEGPSPYLDHKGRPHCPIEAQSAYVTQDNSRYGVVRDMRGPQDEINKRRSKLLHLLSVSQIEAADASAIMVDADEARAEAARPDGVIPFGWRKVSTSDMSSGQALLLAEAKAEIERMGPNPAVLGRDGNDSSGRALLARQQAGLVELAPIFAEADDWELRVYRQIWSRVKQYWTQPQFIRVTDDDGAAKFVGVNQPQYGPPQVGVDQTTGLPAIQRPILGYQNQLGEMDVDIEVDTQQDVGTLAQEQFSDLMQLLGSNPAWAQGVPLEVMIKLSSIPHKQSVLDQIKQARQDAQQQGAAMQQGQQQMAAALAASQIEERKARSTQLGAAASALTAKAALDYHNAHVAPVLDALHAGIADGQTPPPGVQQGPQGPGQQMGDQGVSTAS